MLATSSVQTMRLLFVRFITIGIASTTDARDTMAAVMNIRLYALSVGKEPGTPCTLT